MVRDQRIRLLTGEVAPRWLLILAVVVGGAAIVGVGLAHDLLAQPAATVVTVTCFALMCLVVIVLGPLGRGAIGRRLGFRARLDPNDRERFLLVGLVFVLLLPGAIVAYDVLPMFDLPLPHTCSAALFVVYACAIVPLHRYLLRLLERRRAR
jgi:hypothetical protein